MEGSSRDTSVWGRAPALPLTAVLGAKPVPVFPPSSLTRIGEGASARVSMCDVGVQPPSRQRLLVGRGKRIYAKYLYQFLPQRKRYVNC